MLSNLMLCRATEPGPQHRVTCERKECVGESVGIVLFDEESGLSWLDEVG